MQLLTITIASSQGGTERDLLVNVEHIITVQVSVRQQMRGAWVVQAVLSLMPDGDTVTDHIGVFETEEEATAEHDRYIGDLHGL